MTASPAFTVIIVNYDGGAFLQKAVDSLKAQTFSDFELILVDNASSDGSAGRVDLSGLPSAQLICNSENTGFAAANNLAASQAAGQWLVMLNPDSVADPGWLAALAGAVAAHPGCASFTSAQFRLGEPGILDGAGDAYFVFGIPWRGGFGRPASELPGPGWCFSACGASSMYSARHYREAGGLDERFFCYCEDVDLGFRLQLMGHDCRFVPGAIIHHAGSGISGRTSPFTIYHGTRNRLWTYAKNMPSALFWLTLPGHAALSLYLLVRSAFTPRFSPMLRGLKDGIAALPRLRREPRRRTASLSQLTRRMAWNPLTLSRRRCHVRAYPMQKQAPPVRALP